MGWKHKVKVLPEAADHRMTLDLSQSEADTLFNGRG